MIVIFAGLSLHAWHRRIIETPSCLFQIKARIIPVFGTFEHEVPIQGLQSILHFWEVNCVQMQAPRNVKLRGKLGSWRGTFSGLLPALIPYQNQCEPRQLLRTPYKWGRLTKPLCIKQRRLMVAIFQYQDNSTGQAAGGSHWDTPHLWIVTSLAPAGLSCPHFTQEHSCTLHCNFLIWKHSMCCTFPFCVVPGSNWWPWIKGSIRVWEAFSQFSQYQRR